MKIKLRKKQVKVKIIAHFFLFLFFNSFSHVESSSKPISNSVDNLVAQFFFFL